MRTISFLVLALALVILLAVAGSCGGSTANLLLNPGFEEGGEPWTSLDPRSSFDLTTDRAHTGKSSAHLTMDESIDAEGDRVYYLVQEITPDKFPEVLRGNYFVENWKRGTAKQYLQFVVIAIGAKNNPLIFQSENYQLRYLLAGIDREPFSISNAQFIHFSKEEPLEGQWVHFEARVKDDFQRYWGAAPENFEKIRVLFEVRYDDKVMGDGAPHADVYYDDLSFGSAD